MSCYPPPPGDHWKLKIQDRLDFESYFNGLHGEAKERLRLHVQQSKPGNLATDQEALAEYLRNRTKHFWIIYNKWLTDYNALDLEEDLGEISVDDSDSDDEVDFPQRYPSRIASTPTDSDNGEGRMPAEDSSDEEQHDRFKHYFGSASLDLPSVSPSPELRAPPIDITPPSSNTPPVPKPPQKRRAVSLDSGPRQRLKEDTFIAGTRQKRQRARPRAPKSKVKIARKPRDVHPNELPEYNPHHESFLYPHFQRPPPFDSKSRAIFALDSFLLFDECADTLVSLLAIDRPDSRSDLQLEGRACTISEDEGAEFQAAEAANRDPPCITDGARQILVASHDIIGITLSLDGIYIETRLARYRLHRPSEQYEELAVEAKRLQALYLVGREHYVLGQNRKGTQRVVDTLNEALAEVRGAPSPLEDKLHTSWRTEGLLSPLDANEVALVEILYKQLPNTPYVTPFVFDLVSPFLFHGMVRTDPEHDPTFGIQERIDDEELFRELDQEVYEFHLDPNDPDVEIPVGVRSKAHVSNSVILNPGTTPNPIRVFEKALIENQLYQAGDTILVVGASPHEEAEAEGKVRSDQEDTSTDDEEERDVSASSDFGKQHRRVRMDKSAKLSKYKVPWFGRLLYFYRSEEDEEDGDEAELNAHVEWFYHRRATPLGKVAHARALVHADICGDIDVTTIVRKIKVKRVKIGQPTPNKGFYYTNHWDKETGAYEDFDKLEDPQLADWTLLDAANVPHCLCCARRSVERIASVKDNEPTAAEMGARVSVPVWIEDSCDFSYENISYHFGDLIYITPSYTFRFKGDVLRQPFLLAQLIAIDDVEDASAAASTPLTKDSKVRVRWLHRFDDLFDSSGATDPRRLVATSLTADVDIQNVKGKAIVLHKYELLNMAANRLPLDAKVTPQQILAIGQALLAPDEFWCGDELIADDDTLRRSGLTNSGEPPRKHIKDSRHAVRKLAREKAQSKLPRCKVCLDERKKRLKKERGAELFGKTDPSQRLRALSLYAGADLFGLGLEQGCRVLDVKWAVEVEKDVASACQANRPRTTVFAASVSDFLEAAVQGTKVSTAASADKAPPQQPNVDFILAGAPCQGFSSINKYKKVDDIRCSEPWVYLGTMDWYRPAFSSFENVRAIQHFALPVDAEKGDLLNTLMDALMRLGYQVRPDVYNAASFGAPQIRRRVILTVARRGLLLPAAPKATHAYSTIFTGMSKKPYDGGARQHVVKDCHRPHGHAPHPAVTFAEATSDLPSFGFADPFGNATETKPSQQQWEWGQPIGFADKEERAYEQPLPQTAHQRAARINLCSDKLDLKKDFSAIVLDHVVPPVSEKRASMFAHMGVVGEGTSKGNYLDIPDLIDDPDDLDTQIPLRPGFPPALREERYHMWFQRLKWDDILTPLRTTINPDGTSHGPRIHPDDARQLSIREAARVQGFPDWIQWRDYEEDKLAAQIKMIGNAVPLPLAAALGRELYVSVLTYFNKTKSLKPPPVASNTFSAYAPPRLATSIPGSQSKGKARQTSASSRLTGYGYEYESGSEGDSDNDIVVVSIAPALPDLMDVDDDEDSDEDWNDEEVVLSLVGRR